MGYLWRTEEDTIDWRDLEKLNRVEKKRKSPQVGIFFHHHTKWGDKKKEGKG